MSDSSDQQDGPRAKKRARKRSCDVCRSKKIRCDGPEKKSHEKCTNCQELGTACTYVEMAKRRGPPKGYVEQLELRMMRLEATLKRLHPETDFIGTVGPALDKDTFDLSTHLSSLQGLHIPPLPALNLPKTSASSSRSFVDSPGSAMHSPSASASTPTSSHCRVHHIAVDWAAREKDPHHRRSLAGSSTVSPDMDLSDSDEHDAREQVQMVAEFAKLQTVEEHKEDHFRYHGKSSGVQLLQAVRELKKNAAGGTDGFVEGLARARRREYWTIPAWEIGISNESVNPPDFSKWPEPDLAENLIDAYFRHCDVEFPLLNRVIFRKQYSEGLWRQHFEFTKVVLMVFANGARFVDDPRSYFKSPADTNESLDGTAKHSAGWQYMQAVVKMGKSWLAKPGLHDLQTHVLFCTFMQGSAVPHMTWLIAGIGLRLAQDMGVHLRAGVAHMQTGEKELYSRAFWCLYHIDRLAAAGIGRAVAMQDSDFDAEFPLAVDDEFWETGNSGTDFVQPEGKPSRVSSFICLLRLDHIIECALKTVYAVGKTPVGAQVQDPETQKAIVVELDSALNAWADAVPDSLRWDPSRRDMETFERSAILYAQYYFVQILVHRPFIPTPRRPTTTGFPSLAICSSASRAISNILDVVLRRSRQMSRPSGGVPIGLMMPAFTAAIVLLIGVWGGRKPGSVGESEKAMRDVKKCLRAIKDLEPVWRQAGKMYDILTELASAANMPVETPPSSVATSAGHAMKRPRDEPTESGNSIPATDFSGTIITSPPSYYTDSTSQGSGPDSAPALLQYANAPVFTDMSPPTFPYSFSPQASGMAPTNLQESAAFDTAFVNSLFGTLNSATTPSFGDMDPSSSLLHGYGGAELASLDLLPPTLSPRANGQAFVWPGLFDMPDAQAGLGQTLEGWSSFGPGDGVANPWGTQSQHQQQYY